MTDKLGWDRSHPAWHMAGRDEMIEEFTGQPRQPAWAIKRMECAVCGQPIHMAEVCADCAASMEDVDLESAGGWMIQDYVRR